MSNLSERAMLVTLNIRQWIGEREDKQATAEVLEANGAEDGTGKFRKLLLGKGATTNLRKLACEVRNRYYELTLPWDDSGRRIIGSEMYGKLNREMREFEERWDKGVDDFCEGFPGFVQEAESKLGKLFRPSDYPTVDELRRRFEFKMRPSPVPDARDLRVSLSDMDRDILRKQIEEDVRYQENRAMGKVVERIRDAVSHMSERLKTFSPDAEVECPKCDGTGVIGFEVDGKTVTSSCPKCLGNKTVRAVKNPFRDSLVDNIRELVDLIPGLNISGDPRISSIAAEMSAKLTQYTADELRGDDNSRAHVAAEADRILDRMSQYGF